MSPQIGYDEAKDRVLRFMNGEIRDFLFGDLNRLGGIQTDPA
jgi:hypothetical protein